MQKISFKNLFKMIEIIFDVLYPPKCVFCEKILNINDQAPICENCEPILAYCKKELCCKKCSVTINQNKHNLCKDCEAYERNFKRNVSVFLYTGKVRKTILRYKKMRKIAYSKHFASLMSELFKEEYKNINFDYVVATPISRTRLIERGFNQTHEISKHMAKILKIEYLENILKKIGSLQQKSLSYGDRQTSQIGKIKIKHPEKILGKTVLLVDDVFTTGATFTECTKILKLYGAKEVYCISLARTVKSAKGKSKI